MLRLLFIGVLTSVVLFSCKSPEPKRDLVLGYQHETKILEMENFRVSGIYLDSKGVECYYIDSTNKLLVNSTRGNSNRLFWDVLSDEYSRPTGVSIIDSTHGVLRYVDSLLWINGTQSKMIGPKGTDQLALDHNCNVLYLPDFGKCVATFYNRTAYERDTLNYPFGVRTIGLVDSMGQVLELPFRVPEIYAGSRVYPKYVFSRFANSIVISPNYVDTVYIYDMDKGTMERMHFQGNDMGLDKLKPVNVATREAEMDNINFNADLIGYYYGAYFDPSTEVWYRVYEPSIPELKENGKFNTPENKPLRIMARNKAGITKEMTLGSNRYFVPDEMIYGDGKFYYLNVLKTRSNDKKRTQLVLETITPILTF